MSRSVKSADRIFQMLEIFERERRPLRISQLVDYLQIPQSSISMLVKTLTNNGYMDFNPVTREFCPSVRVGFLCEWVKQLPNRNDELSGILHALARSSGETVLLGRIDGFLLQYLLVIDSPQALRFSPTSGMRRPIHRTAMGIMLISEFTDEEIGILLRRYNSDIRDERSTADVKLTLQEVFLARDQGFYQSPGLATPGAGVIATLLPTCIRGQRLAIGIGAPLDRLHRNLRDYLAYLKEAASQC